MNTIGQQTDSYNSPNIGNNTTVHRRHTTERSVYKKENNVPQPKPFNPRKANPKQGNSTMNFPRPQTVFKSSNIEGRSGEPIFKKPSGKRKRNKKQKLFTIPVENTNDRAIQKVHSKQTNVSRSGDNNAKKHPETSARTAIMAHPLQSYQISPSDPDTDQLLSAGFRMVALQQEDISESTLQKMMTNASASIPHALQPLINMVQQNGLYRLVVPDPVLAQKFASGEIWLSRYGEGFTTSLSKHDGFTGSSFITPAKSVSTPVILYTVFGALSIITCQYYLHHINNRLADMQKKLQTIINHLEIQSLAKFQTCKNKLWDLFEEFCALVNSADTDHPAGYLEKQNYLNQLADVELKCNTLVNAAKITMQMKREELDELISQKKKIDDESFKPCGPIIEKSLYAFQLKLILMHLIVERDRRWTPNTLDLNLKRLDAVSQDIKDIFEFTEHVKQLAIHAENSRGIFSKISDCLSAFFTKNDAKSKYEPIIKEFNGFGERISSTAKSYLIQIDSEHNAKVLPELGS